jgi:hypothetical protein
MNLSEILHQLADIEIMLIESKGELSPEDEGKLKLFTESLTEKVDGYKHFFDRIEMSINYWKGKENEAYEIRKALEKNLENAEEHLKQVMLHKQVRELVGDSYIFKLSPTKGRVEVIDEAMAKELYPREKITVTVDAERLRQDLENGIDMRCGKIIQTYSLRARAITKQKEIK